MANKIEFKIFGDAKDLEKSLVSTKKKFDSLGKNAGLAFVGLTASIVGFTEAARQQELAINQLNQALENTGNYSESASKDLQKYAKSLQSVTLFGDETILRAQSLIASFGFEGETLKELTKATLDLAQAKGMDLVAAADLVSKAVGSSTNALSRYGVEVVGVAGSTDRARDAVKNITKLFGGQAEVAAEGLGVNIQFKNTMGDLAETIGFALAPTVIKLTESMKEFVELADQNPKLIQMGASFLLIGTAVAGLLAGIGFLGSGIITAIGLFGSLGIALTPILTTVTSLTFALPAIAIAGSTDFGLWISELKSVNKWFDDISRKFDFFRITTNKYALVEADRLNAIAVARKKAYDEENADKIAQLKADKEAQLIHEQEIQALKQETQDFIKQNDDELKELSAISNQAELDGLLLKWEQEREGLINHLNLKLELLATAGITEGQQVEAVEKQKADIRSKYDKLETQADKTKVKNKKFTNQELLAIAEEGFQNASTLGKTFSRINAAIQIKDALVQQGGAIMKAWNSSPFPTNLPAVALTTASTAALLASMASQSFAVGTPKIPYDMQATVHKGESVIPKTFAEGIRSGDMTLSGGDSSGGGGLTLNFDGANFMGVTEDIVEQIFVKASEMTKNRTLISGVA